MNTTELGLVAESYIVNGNLVPDKMIIDILSKSIDEQAEEINGVILDGFPRTVAQAEALETMLNGVNKEIAVLIDLKVDDQELISRLLKRGETSGRCDDNLETIKKRLEVYEMKTAPVSEFYKKLNRYAAIDGMGTIDEIFARICTVMDSKVQ